MESLAKPIPNYVYALIRFKMPYKIDDIIPDTLLCPYGETNDVFLVGGLVQPGETLMAGAIHHCRHLVNFCLAPNDRLYLVKDLDGFMDHEPFKILLFFIDVHFSIFNVRARHYTFALVVDVADSKVPHQQNLRDVDFDDLGRPHH